MPAPVLIPVASVVASTIPTTGLGLPGNTYVTLGLTANPPIAPPVIALSMEVLSGSLVIRVNGI
jgi:hypothetical protein